MRAEARRSLSRSSLSSREILLDHCTRFASTATAAGVSRVQRRNGAVEHVLTHSHLTNAQWCTLSITRISTITRSSTLILRQKRCARLSVAVNMVVALARLPILAPAVTFAPRPRAFASVLTTCRPLLCSRSPCEKPGSEFLGTEQIFRFRCASCFTPPPPPLPPTRRGLSP